MSRYQNLFKNDECMYTDDCPLIILSHALTLDSEKDAVLAQIKFQNLDQRMVKAVYVDIKCTGVANEQFESLENYIYLDLSVRQNQQFGSDIPVYLPDRKTRKMEIRCNKVIFSDGTLWENGLEDFFDKFPPKVLLNDIMEPNLFKMLAEDVHKNGVHCNELYFPSEIKMFRLCACGKYNWKNEPVCWNCGHDTDWWKTKISKEYLIQQMDEKEKLHQLEKERLAEEREIKKQESIRKRKKCAISIGVIAIAVVAYFVCTKLIVPNYYYEKGNELFDSHEYDEAIEYYDKIGDYKDSLTKKSAAKDELKQQELNDYYKTGLELFNDQKYDQAIEYFEKADSFGDSLQKISEAKILKKSPGLLKAVEQGLMDDELIHYLEYLDMTYKESGLTRDQSEHPEGLSYNLGKAIFWDEEHDLYLWFEDALIGKEVRFIQVDYGVCDLSLEELSEMYTAKLNTTPYNENMFAFDIEIPDTEYEIHIKHIRGSKPHVFIRKKVDPINSRIDDYFYDSNSCSGEEIVYSKEEKPTDIIDANLPDDFLDYRYLLGADVQVFGLSKADVDSDEYSFDLKECNFYGHKGIVSVWFSKRSYEASNFFFQPEDDYSLVEERNIVEEIQQIFGSNSGLNFEGRSRYEFGIQNHLNKDTVCDIGWNDDNTLKRLYDINDADFTREPSFGMTADEVIASTWGESSSITQLDANTVEWEYPGEKYIYFKNGIVTMVIE